MANETEIHQFFRPSLSIAQVSSGRPHSGQFQTWFETPGQSTLHLVQTGFGFDDNDDILDGQYPWISEEAAFILP
jgi:hypothetical protein